MNEPDAMITLRGVTKSYGAKPVLRGIDLTVSKGQILGYLGPNGAGKTTTVKILTGMLDDFEGEACVGGINVAEHPLEVKKLIGYVPETAALYEALTPMEYLAFIGRLYGLDRAETDRRATEMLDLFGLVDERAHRIATFSKGMQQKVLIVAGMIHNPEVLFLDEPLSGLDANSAVTVKEIIAQLAKRGKTIFYCSHVMDVVERVCDRIIILAEGAIIADGTFEELQAMNKEASLEHIFTDLTSDGAHATVADRFIQTFAKQPHADD